MSFFDISLDKLLLVLVIAVIVIGPERLPGYAQKLGQLVRGLRDMANGARSRMREELGPEFDEVDWKKFDPRTYDPRRIVREALADEVPAATKPARIGAGAKTASGHPGTAAATAAATTASTAASGSNFAVRAAKARKAADEPAPFDAEAT